MGYGYSIHAFSSTFISLIAFRSVGICPVAAPMDGGSHSAYMSYRFGVRRFRSIQKLNGENVSFLGDVS
jgi:hypothetical protein